jgi:hypothetical protein
MIVVALERKMLQAESWQRQFQNSIKNDSDVFALESCPERRWWYHVVSPPQLL